MLTYPEEKDLNANNTEIAKEVSEIAGMNNETHNA